MSGPDRFEVRADEATTLRRWAHSSSVPRALARRARIVLLAGEGVSNAEIARRVGVSRPTVICWRQRYLHGGIAAIDDRPRTRWHKWIDEAEIVVTTLEGPPERLGTTRWSPRLLAHELGIGHTTVARVWTAWSIRDGRPSSFRFAASPPLDVAVTDVVGLHLHPPEKAVVLRLDGGPPPSGDGRGDDAAVLTPALTTALTTALTAATGRRAAAPSEPGGTERQDRFLDFLKTVVGAYPRVPLHVVVDNSITSFSTYQHPRVRSWLQRNPRLRLHFALTSTAWWEILEIAFGLVLPPAVRRGASGSTRELVDAIRRFDNGWVDDDGPFHWTREAPAGSATARPCVVELTGGPVRGRRTVSTPEDGAPEETRVLLEVRDGSTTYAVFTFTHWADDGSTPVYAYSHSDIVDE